MALAGEDAPRLQDGVVELQQRRKPDGAFDLRGARLREPAEMDAAEGQARRVGDFERRQDATFGLEGPALRDRQLSQRICGPADAGKRARGDADAGRVDGDGVGLRGG